MYRDVQGYVRSCQGCQLAQPVPVYPTTLRMPLTGLFTAFSVDFAGPLPKTRSGEQYLLVGVEHLTGWPIARKTKDATDDTVNKFVQEEIIHSFGPPGVIISDNALCFTAKSVSSFLSQHGTEWKTVLAYAPMSNGRAERMVGTLKRAIKKMVLKEGSSWDLVLPDALYGYRRRRLESWYSPFQLLYGIPPRMAVDDVAHLVTVS